MTKISIAQLCRLVGPTPEYRRMVEINVALHNEMQHGAE